MEKNDTKKASCMPTSKRSFARRPGGLPPEAGDLIPIIGTEGFSPRRPVNVAQPCRSEVRPSTKTVRHAFVNHDFNWSWTGYISFPVRFDCQLSTSASELSPVPGRRGQSLQEKVSDLRGREWFGMVPFHCWFSCVSGPVPVAPHVCSFLIPLYCSDKVGACANPEKFAGPVSSF
jgi:hypothetical protein